MRIPSGVTDQYIFFVAVDATDFATRETGLTGFTVYRSRDGAAAVAMTTPTVAEVDATNMPGVYRLLLDEDMSIGAGNDSEEIAYHITVAGMAPVTRTIELYRPKITVGNTLGIAADGDISGNVDGNVVGSVASVTAAITLPTIPTNWLTAAGIAATALNGKGDWNTGKTGYSISGTKTTLDALNDIAATEIVSAGAITTLAGAVVSVTTNADMRGTDSANTTVPPTAIAIRSEMDLNSTQLAAIVADTNELQTDNIPGTLTAMTAHLTDIKGGTFLGSTDSLEAIRNRGDAAWVTGAGGTPPQLLQSTTIATLASQTSFTLTAGSSDNNAYNNAIVVVTDQATSVQKAVGEVSNYVGLTKTITLTTDPTIFTMSVGDTVEIIAALGAAGSGATASEVRSEMDLNSTQLAAIVADTNELQTDNVPGLIGALNDVAATDIVSAGAITTLAGAVVSVTTNADMRGTDGANTTTPPTAVQNRTEMDLNSTQLAAIVADTNELQTDNVPGLIATVQADTNDLQTRVPAALVGGRIDSNVSAIDNSAEAATDLAASAKTIVVGAAATGTLSVTQMTTNLTEVTNDHYNGRIIIWTNGVLKDQATNITAYTGTGGLLTFTGVTEAPSNGDTFVIV